MKTRITIAAVALALWGVVGSASAASITTTFAGGNRFAGNMYDVTTGANALNIKSIDVHTSTAGTAMQISLYTKVGTYVGSENNNIPWALRGTVGIVGGGLGNAVNVDFADFGLAAGTLYGFYVDVANYVNDGNYDLEYTNGNNVFANADLSLNLGIGLGDPAFNGTIFSPRTWNGTIYYDAAVIPEPSTVLLLGTGLLGLVGYARRRKAA